VSAVLDAVVACEIDDFEVFGHGVCLDEFTGLSGRAAAEKDIYVFEIEVA